MGASRISFTVYLNDDYNGGDLSFIGELRMDGTHGGEHLRTHPRKGSAVLFYQGVPEFAHLPRAIEGGTKSIMRADVLYRFADGALLMLGVRSCAESRCCMYSGTHAFSEK